MRWSYHHWLALSFIPQWFFIQWIAEHPQWVEYNYSTTWYIYWAQINRVILGWIPFSVGDVFYIGCLVFVFKKIIYLRKTIRSFSLVKTVAVVALVHLVFQWQWGINYHRIPLSEQLNASNAYTTSSLIQATSYFIDKTNKIHSTLSNHDSLPIIIPYSTKKILKLGAEAIKNKYPSFKSKSIKASLWSFPLSYMGFGGYLNPFTLEAQVNTLQPKLRILTTACHEIAHQLGFAAEDEANYIGMTTSMNSTDPYMRYAGHSLALQYCLVELRKRDKEAFTNHYNTIHGGVIENYREISLFWQQHQNPFEPFFKKSYDVYLKANHQSAGIESYQLVVDLLIQHVANP